MLVYIKRVVKQPCTPSSAPHRVVRRRISRIQFGHGHFSCGIKMKNKKKYFRVAKRGPRKEFHTDYFWIIYPTRKNKYPMTS